MAAKRQSHQPAPVSLTRDELLMVNNALNEVCHGVDLDDDEFKTRLGFPREQVRALLTRVGGLLDKFK